MREREREMREMSKGEIIWQRDEKERDERDVKER